MYTTIDHDVGGRLRYFGSFPTKIPVPSVEMNIHLRRHQIEEEQFDDDALLHMLIDGRREMASRGVRLAKHAPNMLVQQL